MYDWDTGKVSGQVAVRSLRQPCGRVEPAAIFAVTDGIASIGGIDVTPGEAGWMHVHSRNGGTVTLAPDPAGRYHLRTLDWRSSASQS